MNVARDMVERDKERFGWEREKDTVKRERDVEKDRGKEGGLYFLNAFSCRHN